MIAKSVRLDGFARSSAAILPGKSHIECRLASQKTPALVHLSSLDNTSGQIPGILECLLSLSEEKDQMEFPCPLIDQYISAAAISLEVMIGQRCTSRCSLL